jgi:hypothetical protein
VVLAMNEPKSMYGYGFAIAAASAPADQQLATFPSQNRRKHPVRNEVADWHAAALLKRAAAPHHVIDHRSSFLANREIILL